MTKYFNNILISGFAIILPLTGSIGLLDNTNDIVYQSEAREPVKARQVSNKARTTNEVSEWVDELEKYESQGVKDKDDFKRVDVNGYYSYGCMQFQMETFLHFYNLQHNIDLELHKNISIEKARELISNCERQKNLAEWMIQDNPNRYTHWLTSVKRGLGKPPNL